MGLEEGKIGQEQRQEQQLTAPQHQQGHQVLNIRNRGGQLVLAEGEIGQEQQLTAPQHQQGHQVLNTRNRGISRDLRRGRQVRNSS